MTRLHTVSAALLASTALASPVWADLTPQQVWDQTLTMMTMAPGAESTVGATETEGDTLVVRDVVISSDISSEEEMFGEVMKSRQYNTVTYPEMRFTDNGDGTVTMTYGAPMSMVLGGEDTYTDPFEIKMSIDMTDYEDKISGTPESQRHEFSFSSTRMALDEIVKGEGKVNGPTQAVLNDGKGWFTVETGDVIRIETEGSMANMAFNADVSMEDGSFKMVGALDELAIEGFVAFPKDFGQNEDMDVYPEGLAMDIRYNTGAGSYQVEAETPDGPVSVSASGGGESFALAMSTDGFSMDGASRDMKMSITAAQMPFPIDVSASEFGLGFAIPFGPNEEPERAALSVDIADLAVNDGIWNLLDPGENLPRDPATLRIGVEAMVKALFDVTDPDATAMNEVPFDPYTAKITALEIDAVGLKVNGSGEVEFDKNDMTSYPGMPAPIGAINLTAEGANGLIDNLIKMGLIPEDQAMMGRMMMGMFAKPTGDDALSSDIEFKEGGQVFANGQRLK
ncbi:MAG: hypothetical protein CSA72_05765 [Rhodobacterales bacterium]|nr:MAG: hypothetical protein CSA72_05765 [Rhodobacterales bacterium]